MPRSISVLERKPHQRTILRYIDPKKPYVLFTDASKYAWACVLTQSDE